MSESNSSNTFVELLRGRDGLPGRDGMRGPSGPPGPQGKEGSVGPKSGGATYVRWGKSSCPTSSEEVYSGIAAGSEHTHSGSGANHLCMPKIPEYDLPNRANTNNHGLLYGAEYEAPIQGSHDHNVPCAVCHVSTRSAVLMIPGKDYLPYNLDQRVLWLPHVFTPYTQAIHVRVCGQGHGVLTWQFFQY